jgi:hypothetical protein
MERRSRKGQIIMITPAGVIRIFNSQREAARISGISQASVSANANGRYKQVKGYVFMWPDIERSFNG